MLLPIFMLCLSHLVLASPVQTEYDMEDMEQLTYHFNDFMVKHNKSYTDEEETLRFQYFKENLAKINELNRKNSMAVFGINKFADWSAEEMQMLFGFSGSILRGDYGSCSVSDVAQVIQTGSVPLLPAAVDWRQRNAVAPVQNQGLCGSCWAFSSAAVLEGAYALKHNTLLKVSEQQFVDCVSISSGCDGGLVHQAITLSMQQAQELEQDYPYHGVQQQCQFDGNRGQVRATGCNVFPYIGDSDDRLASLLASSGPLSIALDARIFHLYQGGIIHDSDCAAQAMNHAVTLVGYGDEGGMPYWIIKNSYGTGWGENGYVRVQRGVGCLMVGGYVLSASVA